MPEWYKKRILQRPGQETQSAIERPSETYQLELPDFRIPTVTNSEDSIMTGLENRKWRDIWEHKGRASGINNTNVPLQQEHPSLFLLPFAPEVMGSGLGLGVLKTLGGYAGSYAGSKIGNEVGYALDNTFNKQLFEPLGEIVGGFTGFGKGYNLFEKAGMQGALKYLSKTGKDVPRWFMHPELRTNVGRVNRRTFFAEDQTPRYNSNQLSWLNRRSYQSPSASQLEMVPQAAYTLNIQKQTYQRPQTSLTPLKEVFGDSLNIPDMVDFYRGSKPMLFADMRDVTSDPNFTYFQGRRFIDYTRPEEGTGRFYINEDKLKQTIGAYKDLYTSRLNLPNTATVDDIYNHIISNPAKIDPALNKAEDIQDILGLSLGYGIKDAMLFKDPHLLDLDGVYKETVPGVFDMLNKRLASKQLSKTYGKTNGNHMTWQFRHSLLDDWARKQAPKMPLPEVEIPYNGEHALTAKESFDRFNATGRQRELFMKSHPVDLRMSKDWKPSWNEELANARRDFANKYTSQFDDSWNKLVEYNANIPEFGYSVGTIIGPRPEHYGSVQLNAESSTNTPLARVVQSHEGGHATGNANDVYMYKYLTKNNILDPNRLLPDRRDYYLGPTGVDYGELSAHLKELPDWLGLKVNDAGSYIDPSGQVHKINEQDIQNYVNFLRSYGWEKGDTIWDAINPDKMKEFLNFLNQHKFSTIPLITGASLMLKEKE